MKIKITITELNQQIEGIILKNERKENDYKKKIAELMKENETNIKQFRNKIIESEAKYKEADKSLKEVQAIWKRDEALLKQKLEFAEQEVSEVQKELESYKNRNISIAETINSPLENIELIVHRLNNQFQEDLRKRENEFSATKKSLEAQLEILTKEKNEVEFLLKLSKNEWDAQKESLMQEIENFGEENKKLIEDLKNNQNENSQSMQDLQAKYEKKVKLLEYQIEESKTKHKEELGSAKANAEMTYKQLKDFYESEKSRLEKKVIDENERCERKFNDVCKEYEERLKSQADEAEAEILQRDEELQQYEIYLNEETNNLKHQLGLSDQKIQSLEKQLKESKDQLDSLQKSHLKNTEQMHDLNAKERTALNEKIEKLALEISQKDKELSSLTFKQEQLLSALENKEIEWEETKIQLQKEKENLSIKLENTKDILNKATEEYSLKSNDFKREMALAKQDMEFKSKRIEELEKSLQLSEEKYRDTLISWRDQTGIDIPEKMRELTQTNEKLQKKLEEKRKSFKELLSSSNKQIASLEKERAVLAEKVVNLDSKKLELENRFRAEIDQLMIQLKEKKDEDGSEKFGLKLENERLKTMLQEIQKENGEKDATRDRERILWENKFNFLLQQREKARQDLMETQKKFDITLEQLQKRGASDKEKLEGATNSLITSIESRYTSQIRDLQEAHQQVLIEMNDRNKQLEKDGRSLREHLEMEKRGRLIDISSFEKKIQDLLENENKLINEIEFLKKNREKYSSDLHESFSYEKDRLKTKLFDCEKRMKELELQKAQQFLDHEKEKAKWNLERDILVAKNSESLEVIGRLEKKKDLLLKDNEKLKVERGAKRHATGVLLKKEHYRQNSGNMSMSFEEAEKDEGNQSPYKNRNINLGASMNLQNIQSFRDPTYNIRPQTIRVKRGASPLAKSEQSQDSYKDSSPSISKYSDSPPVKHERSRSGKFTKF
ncbi:unnamed protein product [Blepharisma stoltei]|uniref:Uncharacterized protein n=1 Tax=Blepharisma stoltei TaxID=1481888 RepID=A0AAU9ILR2_9CILI|nr:unnamed protein product [Blepharisma stoltei]